jgi:hypothetical protein
VPELVYEEPRKFSRREAAEIFATDDTEAISSLMIGLAYFDPDWEWVLDHCLRLETNDDPQLRYIAALCVSHLARIHGKTDLSKVRPMLLHLRADTESFVSTMADDAIADLEAFLGINVGDPRQFN